MKKVAAIVIAMRLWSVLLLLFHQVIIVQAQAPPECDYPSTALVLNTGCDDLLLSIANGKLIRCGAEAESACTALSIGPSDINTDPVAITTVDAGVFQGLAELKTLYLVNLDLEELPAEVFDDLSKVERLQIENCGLTALPEGLFDDLTSLQDLNLINNKIRHLPLGLFDKNKVLQYLFLSDNPIEEIGLNLFDNLRELNYLRVERTNITALAPGTFAQQDGLDLTFAINVNLRNISGVTEAFCLNDNTTDPLHTCVEIGNYYYTRMQYTKAALYYERSLAAAGSQDFPTRYEAKYNLARMLLLGLVGAQSKADYDRAYLLLLEFREYDPDNNTCTECALLYAEYFVEIRRNDPLQGYIPPDSNRTTKSNTRAWSLVLSHMFNEDGSDNVMVYNHMARLCFEGRRPGGQDYETGLRFLNNVLNLTDNTDEQAIYRKAQAYNEGLGVKENLTLYWNLLEVAANYGQPDACVDLAEAYQRNASAEEEKDGDETMHIVTLETAQRYFQLALANLNKTIVNPTTIRRAEDGNIKVAKALEVERAEHAPVEDKHTIWIILGTAVGVVLLIILLLAAGVYMYIRWHREETAAEIEQRIKRQGFDWVTDRAEGFELIRKHRRDSSMTPLPMAKDAIIKLEKLGDGKFGEVYKGVTLLEGHAIVCAVKYIRDADRGAEEEFKAEIKLLSQLMHPNIIPIVGAALGVSDMTGSVLGSNPEMFMVMEFMDLGSLDGVLKKQGAIAHSAHGQHFTESEFLWFLHEVGKGMRFLAENQIVHRDMAARNVLIATHNCKGDSQPWRTCNMHDVKIADLGLSRKMHENGLYLHTSQPRALPVRSMAPEVFSGKMDTTASDVYMYGVLAWEIYTYGRVPFDHLAGGMDTKDFVERLRLEKEQGYYLARPEETMSEEVYELAKKCWDPNPEQRPTFSVLEHMVGRMFHKLTHDGDTNLGSSMENLAASDILGTDVSLEMDTQASFAEYFNVDTEHENPSSLDTTVSIANGTRELKRHKEALEVKKSDLFLEDLVRHRGAIGNYTKISESHEDFLRSTRSATPRLESVSDEAQTSDTQMMTYVDDNTDERLIANSGDNTNTHVMTYIDDATASQPADRRQSEWIPPEQVDQVNNACERGVGSDVQAMNYIDPNESIDFVKHARLSAKSVPAPSLDET